jgi:hypothetical protein
VFFTSLDGVGTSPAEMAAGYGDALATSLWLGIGLLAVAFAGSFLLPRRAAAVADVLS